MVDIQSARYTLDQCETSVIACRPELSLARRRTSLPHIFIGGRSARSAQMWVWVKIKPLGTAGFSPRFHSPGFHVEYILFDPQPCVHTSMLCKHRRAAKSRRHAYLSMVQTGGRSKPQREGPVLFEAPWFPWYLLNGQMEPTGSRDHPSTVGEYHYHQTGSHCGSTENAEKST